MSSYTFTLNTLALFFGCTATLFGQTDLITSVIPPGVIFEALAVNRDLPTPAKPKYNSTTDMAVSTDKKTVFIAQQTAKRIAIVDIATEAVTGSIRLPNEVTGIAVSPVQNTLYATCSSDNWPAGRVCVIDVIAKKVTGTIAVGAGARAPVVSPDGLKLFVCNRFSNDLSVIDLASQREVKRVAMVREPYCAAITPDGKTVVVGNYLPGDRSTDTSTICSEVSLVNTETLKAEAEIRLTRGSVALAGIAISADGKYAFVTHTINNFLVEGSWVTNGWSTQNSLSVIDLHTREHFNTIFLDALEQGMANPWDITFTDNNRYLCITHAGSHQVSVIDYPAFIDTVEKCTQEGINLIRKIILNDRLRRSIEVTGQSPRALVTIESTIYTAGFFDDEEAAVQKYTLNTDTIINSSFPLGEKVTQTVERKGEAQFYDADICRQNWQSCHSCHPFTRASGLNRILAKTAIVSPKNTTGLVYTWWTSPSTWIGRRPDASNSIAAAIEIELAMQPQESMTIPLESFVMQLKPSASPFREKGNLSEAAKRGKVLFYGEEAQCSACHAGPLFTDNKAHATIVPDIYDPAQIYTPSLVEAWRTGPYGHLGSMLTVREMMLLPNHDQAATKLSAEEIDDVAAYVLSL